MPSEPLRDLTVALRSLGGQRVWSLIISVFGDLAQDEGSYIQGPVLSEIMSLMQVKPEAVRVALHRLRKDRWIASRKSGRTSAHSLTEFGRAETLGATGRIYAPPTDMSAGWHVILLESSKDGLRNQMEARGYTAVTQRLFIGSDSNTTPTDAMVLNSESIPDWLKRQITPNDLKSDYQHLHQILTQIETAFPQGTLLAPIQVAVLRCLIVHNWRRLILKHPDLPATLYTSDWKEHDCRALVSEILQRFPKPAIVDFSQ